MPGLTASSITTTLLSYDDLLRKCLEIGSVHDMMAVHGHAMKKFYKTCHKWATGDAALAFKSRVFLHRFLLEFEHHGQEDTFLDDMRRHLSKFDAGPKNNASIPDVAAARVSQPALVGPGPSTIANTATPFNLGSESSLHEEANVFQTSQACHSKSPPKGKGKGRVREESEDEGSFKKRKVVVSCRARVEDEDDESVGSTQLIRKAAVDMADTSSKLGARDSRLEHLTRTVEGMVATAKDRDTLQERVQQSEAHIKHLSDLVYELCEHVGIPLVDLPPMTTRPTFKDG